MARPRETEARRILREELATARWPGESSFTVMEGHRPETETLGWWHANTPANESSETLRNLAYLRAYLRIARGTILTAGGLYLERRRLWMDRSVISRLERDGYLRFAKDAKPPAFEVTEQGLHWIGQGGWSLPAE